MNARQKAERTGLLFLALLLIGGAVLMYRGNDAVALGAAEKEGILTAEQVKMAFHSVSGRLVKVHVTEGDVVKKGDVVMEIDAKDTDLAIKKTKAQIAQLDAQIASTSGAQAVNYLKADNDETQSFRQIDQQRAAVASAQATLRNAQLDYDRKSSLVEAGAIAQSQLDDATMTLNVAQAGVEQQQQLLDKLLAGAQDTGATDGIALPTIAQERASAANMSNDVAALESQRQTLVVALEELETQKERLTLRAPEDGKILKVLSKEGEMVAAGTPVVLLESNRSYYDIYLSEEQAAGLAEGDEVTGVTVAGKKQVKGTIQLLTQAPGFADLKQSREKGQADLSAFQVRIYIEPTNGVVPGMTIGVKGL
ncbi:HlyD family secretion protein [Selenomonas sp.]|uniref:HlyD family secretion protein n=1 Tax=Selenomonas sp. TaxID=2053611 RepID=UPI0025FA4EE6|nr:biotin/lipoyl-binding protein [Selenomonas sp.]MCI6283473.1 biotin/lipoyl-binding protein [Selenomonas sp.]